MTVLGDDWAITASAFLTLEAFNVEKNKYYDDFIIILKKSKKKNFKKVAH